MRQKNMIFPPDVSSNSRLATAWKRFIAAGELTPSKVRPIIGQSWHLSRERGIAPDIERAETVISKEEIEEMVRKEDLCRAGVSALNGLADILHDTEHVVVLADNSGRILYSIGHEQIEEKLERINFRPGADWAEKVVGPNGVGTPQRLGRPEIVMGYEHYCKGWHPWVCYGAPIHSSIGNQIRGSVDITGPVENVNKEALALTISVAQSVQSGLSIIQYHRRELLRELGREMLHRWSSNGVMIIDENDFIVEYNQNALRYLGLDPARFLSHGLSQLVPGLSESLQNCSKTHAQIELTLHAESETGILRPIKVRLQPVFQGDRCLGLAVIMRDLSDTKRPERRPVRQAPQSRYSFENIRGSSKKIKQSIHLARAAATDPLQSNVLLIGETGTGKELLAHSIHAESHRSGEPFFAINCAAIPKELIESELFGYVPGAFTGAKNKGQKGKFECAHNGTLFLDEINSMSLDLQAKFLRVLDSMEITPVGGLDPMLVDVRVIAAANEKIYPDVEQGRFRLDLFHRLNVLEIPVPALSDRGRDIIELATDFLHSECQAAGRRTLSLTPEVEKLLQTYSWPGNIRELHNVCIRWVLAIESDRVTVQDLPDKISSLAGTTAQPEEEISSLRKVNDELIKRTLEQTNHNISRTARILGIDRTTIYRRRKSWQER